MPNFWQLATTPIFKIQQYSWFLAKDLSWKLHNWYCHNTITYSQIFHSFNTVSSTNHLFLINYTSTANMTTSGVCQWDLPGIGIWKPETIVKFQIKMNYVIHHGQLYIWTELLAGSWDPNYTPGVDFLDQIFLSSKNSG